MKTQIDYNTRRMLQAMVRRLREDLKRLGNSLVEIGLRPDVSLFIGPQMDQDVEFIMDSLHKTKDLIMHIERYLDETDQETPAINRAR